VRGDLEMIRLLRERRADPMLLSGLEK